MGARWWCVLAVTHDRADRYVRVEVLRRRWVFLVPMAALWIVPFLLPAQWTTPAGKPIRVALLQGNLDQRIKWTAQGQREAVNIYTTMTQEQARDIDLIVWPRQPFPCLSRKHSEYWSK
ncbi:hypothetical protein HSBAA_PA_0850 (plasmid) [Vreelandella sulfidaeris]|uniref:CN hydrolase domain-containing protein n=1 Tax=Vreelandella sulfidaeris TaxID=115553 RepID=A0A455UGP4_9GAMM|nr:hypothetical protein HSBAA_PA_0850 [Halomonas sulfidaeris]